MSYDTDAMKKRRREEEEEEENELRLRRRREEEEEESRKRLQNMARGDMLNTGVPGGLDMNIFTPL